MDHGTKRRTLLGSIAGMALLAGCAGLTETNENGDDANDESNETSGNESTTSQADGESSDAETDDDALTEEEIVVLFEVILEEEGIATDVVEHDDDVLELVYLATGRTEEDAAIEIEIIGDVYARAIEAGLSVDWLDASGIDPESGTVLDSFVIEAEWAEAFLEGEIDGNEYFELIVETFEPSEDVEDETEDGDEEDGDDADEEELTEDELVDAFLAVLENEGIVTTAVERTSDALGVTYLATGTDDDTLLLEIEVIADVYAGAVAEGLAFERLNVVSHDPDAGVDLDAFVVETDWAVAYLDDEIGWDEYVQRIDETVEPADSADGDQDDGSDAAEDSADTEDDDIEDDDDSD